MKRKYRRLKAYLNCLKPLFYIWFFKMYPWEDICGQSVNFWLIRYEMITTNKEYIL